MELQDSKVFLVGNAEQVEKAKTYLAEFKSEERKFKERVNFKKFHFINEGQTKTILDILQEKHPNLNFFISWDQKEIAEFNQTPLEQKVIISGNNYQLAAAYKELEILLKSIVIQQI